MASAAAPHVSDEAENLASSISPITTLHPDIIHTHILTRLDGTALAAASSVSSELRHLCTDEDLWRNVCTATWPSLLDPIASHVISTFPGGYRSIFSDAFPSLYHLPSPANHHCHHHAYPPSPELIFAVDIYWQGKPLFSRVKRTETKKKRFALRFEMDIVLVPTTVTYEELVKYLQENFTLSWILIDPTRKRAANLSSWKPVSVRRRRHSYLDVVCAVVIAREPQGSAEMVLCMVNVACWRKVGGELHMTGVRMVIEDMDGSLLWRRESVMVLERAIENGERKKANEVRAKERFEKFWCKREERIKISEAQFLAAEASYCDWFYCEWTECHSLKHRNYR